MLLCLACGVIAAQTPAPGHLLVLSKGDHVLAIVDPATKTVLARMPSGPDPHEVAASDDGKMAYISNYGGGAYHTLTPVDLVNHQSLPAIDLGALRGPHGLVFAGGKVWFTAEAAKAIGRFDPATQKVDWIMGTGQDRTHMLYLTADLKHIYTTNVSSATVSFIEEHQFQMQGPPPGGGPPGGGPNGPGPGGPPPGGGGPPPGPRTDWTETVVPVGHGDEGFDVSPDGKELWTANANDGTLSVIDVASKKVTQTISSDTRSANRLKFTLDGKHVLVALLGGSALVVLDAATKTVIKRIPLSHGAAGIQMESSGNFAYVACTPDSFVAIVNLHTLEIAGKIEGIKNPDGLAWITQ